RQLITQARPSVAAPEHAQPGQQLNLSREQLLYAIEARQFCLAYQPKVSCEGGELAGFEALLRWHHPEHGVIMPDRFIPQAERLEVMDAITSEVLRQGLHWFSQDFLNSRPCPRGNSMPSGPAPTLSFNVSAKNLHDIDFADRVEELCRQHQVACDRV